jgi:hypothetical protein
LTEHFLSFGMFEKFHDAWEHVSERPVDLEVVFTNPAEHVIRPQGETVRSQPFLEDEFVMWLFTAVLNPGLKVSSLNVVVEFSRAAIKDKVSGLWPEEKSKTGTITRFDWIAMSSLIIFFWDDPVPQDKKAVENVAT